ncbi:MAG: suppressor of fused domain protein [Planctomycetes bacterium]|nr:suppressor of fused domain protein [Planctomycetota bacterium]
MHDIVEHHQACTAQRTRAYAELFGGQPAKIFSPHDLFPQPDEHFLIDIFVYQMETALRVIEVAVTNGMSDQRMEAPEHEIEWPRRELIQYFPQCTAGHARRLHDMAWLPLFDGFYLDSHHTIGWEHPAVPDTPWKNAFFLRPLVNDHRDYSFEVEGDPVSFLWHIPISDAERAYKQKHGSEGLIDRLEAVQLPWVFDEQDRPSLLE